MFIAFSGRNKPKDFFIFIIWKESGFSLNLRIKENLLPQTHKFYDTEVIAW